MKKEIAIVALAVILVAAAARYSVLQRPEEPVLPLWDQVGSAETLAATGTVSAVKEGSLWIGYQTGEVFEFALSSSTRLARIHATAAAKRGSPVVIVYSKLDRKPVSAIVSEPFPTENPESVDLIYGTIVSVGDVDILALVDGKERSFVFDERNPLLEVSSFSLSDLKEGDPVTVEYVDSEGVRTALGVYIDSLVQE